MSFPGDPRPPRVGLVPVLYAVLLCLFYLSGALNTAAQDADFSCDEGCVKAFRPVCGADGRTYATHCVAACQGVDVAHHGPCPDEPVLHPANPHVVTNSGGGAADATTPSPPPYSRAARLTRHHLDTFHREGFRYAGQITFTDTMEPRPGHRKPPTAATSSSNLGEPAASSGAAGSSPPPPRVIRVTREGHLYTADLDESVDQTLDSLIQHHSNVSAAAAAAAAAAASGPYAAAHTAHLAHVQALLISLRQWRAYRPRGGGGEGHGGGGSKWARHAVVAGSWSGGGSGFGGGAAVGEHPLEPVLEATGAAGRFAARGQSEPREEQGGPEQGGRQRGQENGGVGEEEQQQQRRQEEQEGEGRGKRSWALGLGLGLGLGFSGGTGGEQKARQQQRQQQKPGQGVAGSGGRGRRVEEGGVEHRPVRRSLGVFDVDDRVDCPRTPTYPFTAVGQINIRDTRGNYVCSGALVGPDVVLTAAHCVFNRAAQTFYAKLDFAPARYRTLDGLMVNPFGVVPWTYVTVYQGYSSLTVGDPNTQDIAVINLSQRIGKDAGWMGVFEPCSPFAPTRYVALTAGYPSDQPFGSCKTTQCVVLQEPCTDAYLYHKCDTASGQSGSPMYMMAMTSARRMGPYIRGVHNIEWVQENANGVKVSHINSAVGITPDHYRSILAWIGMSFTTADDSPMGPASPPATTPSTGNGTADTQAAAGSR